MNIISILLRFATGGVSGLINYGFDALNKALSKIKDGNKARVQAAFNIAQKVASTLNAFKWACPTKWQTAYIAILNAVSKTCAALEDLTITEAESKQLISLINTVHVAWNSDDDETCAE